MGGLQWVTKWIWRHPDPYWRRFFSLSGVQALGVRAQVQSLGENHNANLRTLGVLYSLLVEGQVAHPRASGIRKQVWVCSGGPGLAWKAAGEISKDIVCQQNEKSLVLSLVFAGFRGGCARVNGVAGPFVAKTISWESPTCNTATLAPCIERHTSIGVWEGGGCPRGKENGSRIWTAG